MGRRHPRPTAQPPEEDAETSLERAEPEQSGPREGWESLRESLLGLEKGQVLALSRTQPTHARGWLEDYPITPGVDDIEQLRQHLRDHYGGGTYVIQWKVRRPNNKVRFESGAIQVSIAGEPLYQGRRYLPGGRLEDVPRREATGGLPVVVQAAAANPSPDARLQEALLGLVERAAFGRNGGTNQDVVGLVRALQGTLSGSQASHAPTDQWEQIERVLGLAERLSGERDRDRDRDYEPRGGGGLEDLLLTKLLGALGGGGPPQSTSAFPMTGPPGCLWDPQSQRWVAAPQLNPQPPPTQEQVDESEEYEPLTADELLEDLASRSPEDRERFLSEVMERAGELLGKNGHVANEH